MYISNTATSPWTDLVVVENSDEGWTKLSGSFEISESANVAFGMYASAVEGRTAGFDNWTLTKHATATMKCAAGKYGTFAAPFDVTIPEGVTAYSAALNDAGTVITLTEVAAPGATLAAGTPVLIYSEDGLDETTLTGVATTDDATCSAGILNGALKSGQAIPGGSYVLQTQDGKQQFYQLSATANVKSNVNRCWIELTTPAKSPISIVTSSATAVKSVEAAEDSLPVKRIVGGQLLIEKDGRRFNAMGQEK